MYTKPILSLHYNEKKCISLIFHQLLTYVKQYDKRPIILICIGTDRCIGDAVGPFIGSYLYRKKLQKLHVFGTLENPVHALNLKDTIDTVYTKFEKPIVIALDASLGEEKNIGYINILEGPLSPGTALFKKLPQVGDIHITATVNKLTANRMEVLQNTRLHLITSISNTIANAFVFLDRYLNHASSVTLRNK